MRTKYYINKNDKVYDVKYLPENDIVRRYVKSNYSEISYEDLDDEILYIYEGEYYPELLIDISKTEYKNYLIDNRIILKKNTEEYSNILYKAISKNIAKAINMTYHGRIKDFMINILK